ncbi:hypothetical protein EPYR_03447 [Erwinia pyrifoliae DSM 12163]|nr:hypothetical protein EPYR_03447 [Erwinia pyrifoliae DSM 12163]
MKKLTMTPPMVVPDKALIASVIYRAAAGYGIRWPV